MSPRVSDARLAVILHMDPDSPVANDLESARTLLRECHAYFAERAEAEVEDGRTVPNREMRLMTDIEAVIGGE